MKESAKLMQSLFYAGAHSTVIDRVWDRSGHELKSEDLPYLIGSLCFMGRLDEAEALLSQYQDQLSPKACAFCLFFVVMGASRNRNQRKAYQYILRLARLRRHEPAVSFWFYQGMSFLRFTQCRFQNAMNWAEPASFRAAAMRDLYARALASDLKGHCQVALGNIWGGLQSLEQALVYFKEIGNESHARSMARSLVTYRVKHSVDGSGGLAELESMRDQLQREDNNFSLAGTYLEIARIHSLTGELSRAEQTLESAREIIHRDGLHIYTQLLAFRRAYILLLRGQPTKTLAILKQIQPELLDLRTRVQVLGLQNAAEESLGFVTAPEALQLRLLLQKKSRYALGDRIESRRLGQRVATWGRDPLGDLLDELRDPQYNVEEKLERIGRHGCWTFVYDVLDIRRDANSIVLNALPGMVLVLQNGEVGVQSLQSHSQISKLFEILSYGAVSKELLVNKLWGYDYNPLRHDPLIYGLISRARSVLGSAEDWLLAGESAYSLRERVQVIQLAPTAKPVVVEDEAIPELTEDINQRQRKILRYLETHDSINVNACQELFESISKNTITRDLTQLVERNYLQRTGRARNTNYVLHPNHTRTESL